MEYDRLGLPTTDEYYPHGFDPKNFQASINALRNDPGIKLGTNLSRIVHKVLTAYCVDPIEEKTDDPAPES